MKQTPSQPENKINAWIDLVRTVHTLRAPGGCPWDRAQTHQSLRPYLIEEAYEVLDVLDQIQSQQDLQSEKIREPLQEELGDVLMQVLLHSEMASEAQAFDVYDVVQALNDKLIRRHPHVFSGSQASSSEAALQNWEKEKAKEKASKADSSVLSGVPRGLPSLQRAARVLEKVTHVGFQWKDMTGPMDKVVEEWEELKVEIQELQKLQENAVEARSVAKKKIEAELGDLLFTLCNLGYLLKVNPEDALRGTLVRFEKRFRHVEKKLKELGKTPEQSDLKEMDQFWSEAKNLEKFQVWGLTGGIAAGKSTVARFFEKAGIPVIDADQIARELSQPGGLAHERIEQCFGTTDPQVLREKIFTNPASKSELESILHPLIQEESSKRIQKLASQFPVVIYEAALLAETGRFKDLHGLIVIEAPQEDRLKRLLIRSGMTEEIAKRILSSQLPDSARAQNASVTIENRGSLEDLESKVQKWIQEQNWNMPQRSKI